MKQRELIKNIIEHKKVERVGMTFSEPYIDDICWVNGCKLVKPSEIPPEYFSWGKHKELIDRAGGFGGEVMVDNFSNIIGRLNGITKGECIKGAITDWEDMKSYELPELDASIYTKEEKEKNEKSDKYMLVWSPFAVFSVLRDVRLMDNALMDILLEPEYVKEFLNKILKRNLELISYLKDFGIDGILIGDDWGTQDRTFISPAAFRELFKPVYKALADELHSHNMHLFVHSCGYNYAFMEDFIDAGVDVLQFDQLGLYGYEEMANEFAGRVTFWSPLDIQKTLPTGDKKLIESEALKMIEAFDGKGSLIIKDYPTYEDIGVEEEWANWAKNVFTDFSFKK